MPLATDPGGTVKCVLESDHERPEEKRPTFVFRVLTGRDYKQLMEVKAKDLPDTLANQLARWEKWEDAAGVKIEFSPDVAAETIRRYFNMEELLELTQKLVNTATLEVQQLGESVPPLQSDSAKSAKDAAPAAV